MKLSKEIEEELRELEAWTLLKAERRGCFSIPEGYFDQLSHAIFAKLRADETAEDAHSLLKSIGKKNPFEVPAGYFENLAEQVAQNATRHAPAKVIPLHTASKNRFRTYMAAAGVAAILGIGALLFWQAGGSAPVGVQDMVSLENVPDETLSGYLSDMDDATDLNDNPDLLFLSYSSGAEGSNLETLLHEIPEEDLIGFTSDFL